MKRFKDSEGNMFVEIDGVTYWIAVDKEDLDKFAKDKSWADKVHIRTSKAGTKYASYQPNWELF